ncbi:MAG: LysM peptidoglycan-binding domain-containing protein [Bdellovibrionales bacterium]|nr:LysM peptidoglycan-binding domain-containing protein [Bdellovibrionales bacterium]
MSRFRVVTALISLIFTLSGCSLLHRDKEPPSYLTHTVQCPGESLSIISLWYTGDISRWPELLAHNPHIDLKRMRLGTKVQIPMEIVQQYKPPTKLDVARMQPKKRYAKLMGKPESPRAQMQPYQYPVSKLKLCDGFEDTPEGLDRCAEKLARQVEDRP